jgi:hypothetical protein
MQQSPLREFKSSSVTQLCILLLHGIDTLTRLSISFQSLVHIVSLSPFPTLAIFLVMEKPRFHLSPGAADDHDLTDTSFRRVSV